MRADALWVAVMTSSLDLATLYDQLWEGAVNGFLRERVEVDPFLSQRATDLRRGATLIIRPSAAVVAEISAMLVDLAAIEPDQHYYRPEELHVTVLSLFTATPEPEPFYARLPLYQQAIAAALAGFPPFAIDFHGITASPSAIMVQGYPEDDQLNHLRDRLRVEFQRAGLGEDLDRRYRIVTAHITAMRFQTAPRNLPELVDRLRDARELNFGRTRAHTAHLVKNDWYMSHDRVQLLHSYPLRAQI